MQGSFFEMENEIFLKRNKAKQHKCPFFLSMLRGEKVPPGCPLFNLEGNYAPAQDIHVFMVKQTFIVAMFKFQVCM